MREISELQSVDFSMGSYIAGAFANLEASKGPSQFNEFLTRPVAKKIYRHEFETPTDLIRSLRGSRKNEVTQVDGKISNLPQLPIVVYSRKPGMITNDDRRPIKRSVTGVSDDPTKVFEVLILPVTLEYKLALVAWDMPTLDRLQLVWYAYAAFNDKFLAKWVIGEEVFETTGIIEDHQAIAFTDTSEVGESGRLYAAETDIRVSVQIAFGKAVSIPGELILSGFHVGYLE